MRATAASDTSRASDAEVIAGSLDDLEDFAVIFGRRVGKIYRYAAPTTPATKSRPA